MNARHLGHADELTVHTPDDRTLEVLVIGPSDGLPLIFQHGTPGGVAVYPAMAAAAAARGLRLVLYARPGYGGSTPAPGRSVAAAADDIAVILAELGAARFVTAGWSGGGPHALACARLLPGQCMAAASLACPAPYPSAGLDWMAGMAPENVEEFSAAIAGEGQLTGMLESFARSLVDLDGDQLPDVLGELVSPVDRHALRGELADYFVGAFRSGLRYGVSGWRDDDLAFVRDWGFSLQRPGILAPVAIWHGDQDRMVPLTHAQWLASHIPAARAHFVIGTGHLSLPFDAIFDDLLGLAGAR